LKGWTILIWHRAVGSEHAENERLEVLAWVRAQPVLKRLPVIVLTASTRRQDGKRAFDLGANVFLVKPIKMNELITMTLRLRDWLEYDHFPSLNEALSN
jgi:CheY-like chemotaxis protein